MDVLVLASVVGLTTILPSRLFGPKSNSYLLINALGLSLSLFGISVLELVPSSVLLWIDNHVYYEEDEQNSFYWFHNDAVTVAGLYRIVLWSMAILCTVLIPSSSGLQLLTQRPTNDNIDHEEQKKRSFIPTSPTTTSSQYQKSVKRILYKILTFSIKIVQKVTYVFFVIPGKKMASIVQDRMDCNATILPIVSSNDETTRLSKRQRRKMVLSFVKDPTFRRRAILGSVGGTVIVGTIFMVMTPIVVEPITIEQRKPTLLLNAISWLCAVGLLISSLLNGFGSVSMPYTCLAGLFIKPIHPNIIANAEIELERTKVTLKNKIKELETAGTTLPSGGGGSQTNLSIWKTVVRKTFRDISGEVNQRKQQLYIEIEFLETLIDEMYEDVDEMKYSHRTSVKARTPAGQFQSWIGILFSIILLIRLFFAISSVWFQYDSGIREYRHVNNVDPVTRLLLWLLGHHYVNVEDLHTLSQCISLVLTAVLSFTQIRTFLRTVTTVQRRISNIYRRCYCKPRLCTRNNNEHKSSSLSGDNNNNNIDAYDEVYNKVFWHITSILMCCYCLACIVLTKMMLPYEYRSAFSAALGVGNREHHELFKIRTYAVDSTFASMAVLSAALLCITLGIMRSNARRYSTMMDNSTFLTNQSTHEVDP